MTNRWADDGLTDRKMLLSHNLTISSKFDQIPPTCLRGLRLTGGRRRS